MRFATRFAALSLFVFTASAGAQKVNLLEPARTKDVTQTSIQMKLTGERVFEQDNEKKTQKVAASADHRFTEKVLAVHDKHGLLAKVARHYEVAKGTINVDGAISKTLRKDRSVTVAQRAEDCSFTAYSLGGTMTRDELEIISEHFDTLCIAGLLPGKEVAVGDTWKLNNAAVLGLCQFEGLIQQELKGTLKSVDGEKAKFTIAGTAQGIELGANVNLTINVTGTFDVATQRIIELEWKQEDSRTQGPASPGFKAEVVVNLARISTSEPKELTDSALEAVPQNFDVPPAFANLVYVDPQGKFELAHARDWKFNGRTDQHTVFRLLERGDFVAQVTITPWKRAEPGQHQDENEFKKDMKAAPDFTEEQVLQEGEIKIARPGWYIYRMSSQGTTGGVKSVQTYFLVTAPNGEQVVVTFTMNQTQMGKLGARDLTLVEGLSFGDKK